MRSLIGITAGEIHNLKHPWSPVTYGQTHTYSDAIIHASGTPIILPLTSDDSVLYDLYKRIDGVLLAGGNDIDPGLYGETATKETEDISKFRDSVEVQLIEWAIKDNKPILAICRGMQILNVARGGSLIQHISASMPEAQDHTRSTLAKDIENIAHTLKIEPESKLEQIIGGPKIKANTHHHQAVDKLGKDLAAVAWAEDGIIEAIEDNKHRFLIGVQCHPESLEDKVEPRWQTVFQAFVDATNK